MDEVDGANMTSGVSHFENNTVSQSAGPKVDNKVVDQLKCKFFAFVKDLNVKQRGKRIDWRRYNTNRGSARLANRLRQK